jgi:ADP-ribose pyrophosphatase YjhB (NUDIX family)
MTEESAVKRPAARVLILDRTDRLLLLFDPDPEFGGYWYPPGGRVEPGETPEAAALRELQEELGLDLPVLGPVVLRRRVVFHYRGRTLDADEWHFSARAEEADLGRGRLNDGEAAAVAARRWWSLAELRASTARIYPEGVASIVEDVLRRGAWAADAG